MPDWQSDVWGFSTPIRQQKEKAFHSQTTFPLAVWIDARWESRTPPPTPLHFHHRHSSPKLHPCSVLLVGPHDKLLLGLLSKISTRQREWLGRGGRGRGVRKGFKACWGSADKGEGQISPAADKQKEFISITNGCCLKATESTAKVTRRCVFTWTTDYSVFIFFISFWLNRTYKRKEVIFAKMTRKKNHNLLLQIAQRFHRELWNVLFFLCDTLTLPLSLFACALSKTTTLYTATPPLSSATVIRSAFLIGSSSPPFPSFLCHTFAHSHRPSFPSFLCLLCWWSLIEK